MSPLEFQSSDAKFTFLGLFFLTTATSDSYTADRVVKTHTHTVYIWFVGSSSLQNMKIAAIQTTGSRRERKRKNNVIQNE